MENANLRPKPVPLQDRASGTLTSWKDIASFLRTSVRTVQRWEQTEHLPVHRHKHASGGTVYAKVSELDAWLAARSKPPDLGVPESPPEPGGRRRSLRWATALSAGALLASVLWFDPRVRLQPPLASLAVLPFTNERSDTNTEYLSEGLADGITRRLSGLPQLPVRVIAQTAVAAVNRQTRDPLDAGRLLNAEAVLTGSVTQRGSDLSIRVELVSVRDNTLLWGERFDRKLTSVPLLREQIVREIASTLHLRLSESRRRNPAGREAVSPEAHRNYLRGRYHWNRRTAGGLNLAIDYFQRAIAEDPAYALAYAGLAESYAVFSYYSPTPPGEIAVKGMAAARKALELDPSLSEAWTARAHLESDYEWRWEAAEQHFRQAIALDDNNATAHHWFSEHLAAMGRFAEQWDEINRAAALDPLSPVIANNRGRALYFTGRYDDAAGIYRKVAAEFPQSGNPRQDLGKVLLVKGMYREATEEFHKMQELGGAYIHSGLLALAYGLAGDSGRAREIQQSLIARSGRGYLPPYVMALAALGLGDRNGALTWIEKAANERSQTLRWIGVEPLFDGLRDEPRFRAVVLRMGLPLLSPSARRERAVSLLSSPDL
ncbi:MAG: hypothetical protein JNK87_15225 [Bryobacterales bacterium]|nr:hypothetical protein [Bryobacterales bacterium]